MKIALVAPPLLPIPPVRYGGTERIVGVLAEELHRRGHEVTLFAPGDSTIDCRLVPTVPAGLWNAGFHPDPAPYYAHTVDLVRELASEFDVIHSHLDDRGFDLAAIRSTPVVATLHGRTDIDPLRRLLLAHPDAAVIAISDSQRSFVPGANWVATIHHGLLLDSIPAGDGSGGYLLFVGRLSHDKGVAETVELARRTGQRLLIAAKAIDPRELEIYDTIVAPAVEAGVVEFIGEVDEAERDRLLGRALATVMLSRWPEPFGLVAIESLATGTPLIARRSGALPEIVADGVDGFVVDDVAGAAAAVAQVGTLDRGLIRTRALARFTAEKMVDGYVAAYRRLIDAAAAQGAHSRPL